jgi:hypothetical protein
MANMQKVTITLFIALLILVQTGKLSGQVKSPASVWYFGDSIGLDFKYKPPSVLFNGNTNSSEALGTISDENGNLLFYNDGLNIWNSNHDLMEDGTGLKSHGSASQSGLIVNHPENDSLFYVFLTPYAYNYTNGLNYCIVNKNLNNGLGKVVERNILLHNNSSEKVSAVYHANGRDIWIIGHEWGNNCFFLYLLTKNGINSCPIIQCLGETYRSLYRAPDGSMASIGQLMNQGFLKFAPNGKFLSHIYTPNFTNLPSELYEFNNLNGTLNHLKDLVWIDSFFGFMMWGNSFSSNSNNLYMSTNSGNGLIIYNIEMDSFVIVNNYKTPIGTNLELGTDGNIYIGIPQDSFVGIIKNANDIDSFEIDSHYLNLSPGNCGFGFPNIFTGYLTHHAPRIMYESRCDSQTFDFRVANATQINKWIFSHQYISSTFTRTGDNFSVTFNDTGLWLVQCILSTNDTITTAVYLEPVVMPGFLGNDTIVCTNTDTVILIAPDNMNCYLWQDNSSDKIYTATQPGIYHVTITASDFCVYSDTIEIVLDKYVNVPQSFLGTDTGWCFSESELVSFKAPDSMYAYLWSTGSHTQEEIISGSGNYWVKITTPNQCELSDTVSITIDTLNLQNNFLGADLRWCENSDTTIVLEAPSGKYHYLWNDGSDSNVLLIEQEGLYWLRVSSTNDFCFESDTVMSIIDTIPIKPEITQQNDSLILITSYQNVTYHWYWNNTLLPDTANFIKLAHNGTYHLIVYNEHDCFSTSESVIVDNVNLPFIDIDNSINIYPNPAGDNIFIEFKKHDSYTVTLTDIAGKELHKNSNITNVSVYRIPISNYSQGIYFVIIRNENKIITKKVIKE